MRLLLLTLAGAGVAAAVPAGAGADAAVQPRQNEHNSAWVTINSAGVASTITPVVQVNNGQTSTSLAPPADVTATGIHTLTISGTTTTSTGLYPVATAGRDGHFGSEGAFLACDVNQGTIAPFCLPKTGSTLNPGMTYYITWNPQYFGSPNAVVDILVKYSSGNGFNSPQTPASRGFFAWSVPSDFANIVGKPVDQITISLNFTDEFSNTTAPKVLPGPLVWVNKDVMSRPLATSAGGGSGPGILPTLIAVPIVAVLVLGLAVFCCLSYRKKGSLPLIGGFIARRRHSHPNMVAAMPKRASSGYGERQSHSQRAAAGGDAKKGGAGVQLSNAESWSPTSPTGSSRGGPNVFREEVNRQEAAGR